MNMAWRRFLVWSLMSAGVLASGWRAEGQIVFEKETRARLTRPVTVTLEETTLGKALAALSQQTGLTIRAESFLQARALTVQIGPISALNALNALAELGDWQWIETEKGVLRFARRRLRVPAEPAAIPRLIQNAFPLDLRDYLLMPKPSEDMTRLMTPATRTVMVNGPERMQIGQHRGRLYATCSRQLFDRLKPAGIESRTILFTELTPEQRESLIGTLVGQILQSVDPDLLHYDLWPHVSDPASTELELHPGGLLAVQTHIVRPDGSRTIHGYDVVVQTP
jgi:hypothetical protein